MAPTDPKNIQLKRKRTVLSIKQKVDIINELKRGVSVKNLAEKFKIGANTVYDLKKNQEKILKFFAESDSSSRLCKRKVLKNAEQPLVDKATYDWFRQNRFKNVPISGAMIIEQAKKFHEKLNIRSKCEYSQGWLGNFKNRHGIHSLRAAGEKQSADYESATLFVEDLAELIKKENLTMEQVYNADETAVFWKCIPRTTLASSNEYSVEGAKESKERVTVLTCSNAEGTHKCRLLVIGKSFRPRALKDVRELPVIYKANKRAWVTQELFMEWFNNHFVPEAREHCKKIGLDDECKILLLLDNCPAHPNVNAFKSENVLVRYLPAHCTSLIQPQDQGIIWSFKCHYRKEVMRKLIGFEDCTDITTFQKSFNIKNAIWCLSHAWNAVTNSVLKNAWSNILCTEEYEESNSNLSDNGDIDDVVMLANQDSRIAFDRNMISSWINCDSNAPVFAELSDDEIIEALTQSEQHNSTDSSDEEIELRPKVSIGEAITACDTLTNFLQDYKCEDISIQDQMQIYRIKEILCNNKLKNQKQATIQRYFHKKNVNS